MASTKKITNAWDKMLSPLRGMTQNYIEQMFYNARQGNDTRLQYCYYEIEKITPIFNVCIEKRLAGVVNRQWDIVALDNSSEATKQAELIKKVFLESDTRNGDGLTDAIRHLCMSVFRGRSAVKPFFTDDNKLILKPLQNWNFLAYNNKLYWNPECETVSWLDSSTLPEGVVELPEDEVCYILNERPIDMPGILIYLRQLVGEEQYARFTEKCGIPQVILTAPEGTPDDALELWNRRAQAIFEGGSGSLQAGSNVHLLTEGRGQNVFTDFIQHQMEQISILATGGTLLTMAGSTGLGSDLARVQQESFNSLINLDCKRISNAITNCIVRKCVQKFFNTDQLKIRFEFIEADETTSQEYLDLAEKCKALGIAIDVAELKKLTKLSFIKDTAESGETIWSPPYKTEQEMEDEK